MTTQPSNSSDQKNLPVFFGKSCGFYFHHSESYHLTWCHCHHPGPGHCGLFLSAISLSSLVSLLPFPGSLWPILNTVTMQTPFKGPCAENPLTFLIALRIDAKGSALGIQDALVPSQSPWVSTLLSQTVGGSRNGGSSNWVLATHMEDLN